MSNKTIKAIVISVGSLVLLLIAGAFYLSFDATSAEAAKRFASDERAWAVPFILEGGVITFILWTFVRGVLGQPRTMSQVLVLAYTALIVLINASHATYTDNPLNNSLTAVFSAMPPLTVFFAAEAFVSIFHTMLTRQGKAQTIVEYNASITQLSETLKGQKATLDNLTQGIESAKAEKDELSNSIQAQKDALAEQVAALRAEMMEQVENDITKKKDALEAKLEGLKTEVDKAEKSSLNDVQKAILMIANANPDMTQAEIGRIIDRSSSTMSTYVKQLTQDGYLYRNGHGWEVKQS